MATKDPSDGIPPEAFPSPSDTEKKGGPGDAWVENTTRTSHDEAQAGNQNEHQLSVREALRTHKAAVFWSLTVSMSIIMEGYDNNLIGNFMGYPAFQKQFGVPLTDDPNGRHEVEAHWQSALWASPIVGSIIGAFLNGYLIKAFGFKKVFSGAMLVMIATIFPSFFGKSVAIQVVGQALCGVPWGIFATIGPAYASEILPLALRPYLTAYTNMCFAIGQFISMGALQGLMVRNNEWSYRIAFAIQWIWPPFLLIAGILMPESPWWLVRQGRHDEAEKVLRRVTSGEQREKAHQTLAMMVHTNKIECEIEKGSSYLDCFKGINARRTEIACGVFIGQVTSGSSFAYSGTYFYIQAGMTADDAYKLGVGGTAIAFVGTIISWYLMRRFGRRSLYLAGLTSCTLCLFVIGMLTVWSGSQAVVWVQSCLCILWLLSFSLSIGPVGWAIPAEVSSTRLRSKTICIARNAYYLAQLISNVIQPYMMNPTMWNWKGYTGFFWFGTSTLTLVWGFFRLTETKDRTFEELDVMFAAKVPTRNFKTYHVDAYAENVAIKDRAAS